MIATNVASAASVVGKFALGLAARSQSAIRPASLVTFQNIGGIRYLSSIDRMNVTVKFSPPLTNPLLQEITVAVEVSQDPVAAFDKVTKNMSLDEKRSLALKLQEIWTPNNQEVVEPVIAKRGGAEGQAVVSAINAERGAVS